MAICIYCKKEMLLVNGCTCAEYTIDGLKYTRIQYRNLHRDNPCKDCGAKDGRFHHPGCELEICPKCGYEVTTCRCIKHF